MTPSLYDSSVLTIDLPAQAAWFREALRFGLVSVREVTDWAAELVGESISPNDSLLELSFMNRAHPLDLVSILAGLSRDVAPFDVLPEILGVAHERVRADPAYGRHLSHALYHLYWQSDRTVPAELKGIIGFEDAYGLADCKSYGTVAEVQRDLETFTGTFRARVGSRFKPPGR